MLLTILLLIDLSSGVHASPLRISNPLTNCLNDHIVPQAGRNLPPAEIINNAFGRCYNLMEDWLSRYSPARRQQLRQALFDYYIDWLVQIEQHHKLPK
ncbi:hypothetical protein CIG19_08610 [Enterobacterales bacterium CwR94]|nr:hypothetical protein CIG19_08610 [Enterobacterales bacterium CwR94]